MVRIALALALAWGLLIGGALAAGPADFGPAAPLAEPIGGYVGRMVVLPNHGQAGTTVRVEASGLPADDEVDLVWRTMRGEWKVSDGEYHGRAYQPVAYRIARLRADASGKLATQFTAPDDFGFGHDVVLQKGERLYTQANFNIDMSVEVSPKSGPLGTPIQITMKGIGWRELENSWTLSYDNAFTGWISAVTTQGTAKFTIPATGAPGLHNIAFIHGEFTFPYLNPEQNPRPDRPRFTESFTLTPGPPVLPPPVEAQLQKRIKDAPPPGSLMAQPALGPIKTPITVSGEGFKPGQSYGLEWASMSGNRVGGGGFGDVGRKIAEAKADASGKLSFAFAAPDDLGGAHRLSVKTDGATREGWFTTLASAQPLDVAQGPAGTPFKIHLKGVGWTETANIYTVVYDNGYAGYACGFNSQGDIEVFLRASGAPGWHYIDLYPAIYKGKEARPNNFRIPQLTYADDHPGEDLPAFHFAFRVTEDAAPSR